MYDIFGLDGILYTKMLPFLQKTDIPFSQLNNDVVDGIIGSSEFNSVVEQKISDATGISYYLSVNDKGYVAGIGIKVDGVEQTSVMTVIADRFSIISSGTASDSTKIYPFIVQNGKTWINSAIIQDAAIGTAQIANAAINNAKIADASINAAKIQDGQITNAKIGNTIQSNNYVANSTGWLLNKGGNFYINGSGNGRMIINNTQVLVYDANNVLRVRMGLW